MTDEIQSSSQEMDSVSSQAVPEIIPSPTKKPSKLPWIILGIVVAGICIGSILCMALGATGVGKIIVERAPVESVLDTFMIHMAAKDIDRAYALFSPRAKRQMPISDLEKALHGNNFVIFEGYQSLSIQNFNITAALNTNPDLPQGTVANVKGTITYDDNFTGQITAILEKVDGVWMLHNFSVVVPPDKLQP